MDLEARARAVNIMRAQENLEDAEGLLRAIKVTSQWSKVPEDLVGAKKSTIECKLKVVRAVGRPTALSPEAEA